MSLLRSFTLPIVFALAILASIFVQFEGNQVVAQQQATATPCSGDRD